MSIGASVAIWFLFFVAVAFVSLSFGVRTSEEVGAERVAGQADSAPHRFDVRRHVLRAALIATLLFVLYDLNWTYGWIGIENFDFYHRIFTNDG
jgi:predicted secreted protein